MERREIIPENSLGKEYEVINVLFSFFIVVFLFFFVDGLVIA
jgi:hypothetical protein